MDRTRLLQLVSTAASLDQISTVMAGVRTWLVEHPDDEEMRSAFQQLARLEREHFTYGHA
jgi:hypothetical protein